MWYVCTGGSAREGGAAGKKGGTPMKKVIALCMAALMSLALLAGCTSADPENPYGQEPAPMNGTTAVLTVEQV